MLADFRASGVAKHSGFTSLDRGRGACGGGPELFPPESAPHAH
jgi:hypothetical protein